ncbi:MAG: signal peptidase I [Thermoleophilia bacterium]|jgi:signal peptidase I|nr:signal peptidase I [Thermoleophilia bacterium]
MSLPRTARFVLREIVLPLGLAVLLALTIQATIAKPYEIPTASMDPTILPNDRVLSNRFIYHVRDIRHGDIIVFDPPASLHSDVPFVKRVVGLPGDTVEVRAGTVLVNGSPYDVAGAAVPRYQYGPATVPPGSLFVLGDNRNNSMDSHEWDFLARDSVKGEVFMIYWPLDRLRIF